MRAENSKIAFVEKLKKEYGFSENKEDLESIKDLNIEDGPFIFSYELFTYDGKVYGLNEFDKYLESRNIDAGSYISYYEKWVEDLITQTEDAKLEDKYPEFHYMMQEYHDGILLFNISEEKIWNFASEDSVGLQAFYEKNKDSYFWNERFKGLIVTCKNEETREKADLYFSEDMTVEEIEDMINEKENLISIAEGAWEKGANPVVDYYIWNQPEPANFDSKLTFVRGDVIPPEPKTLEEARGLYISDYQKYLEDNWIKELRKKYEISINKRLLKTIKGA